MEQVRQSLLERADPAGNAGRLVHATLHFGTCFWPVRRLAEVGAAVAE